jgi:type II secretory pathway pseudopilin PulG
MKLFINRNKYKNRSRFKNTVPGELDNSRTPAFKNFKISSPFTLIELIAAMAVFSVIMLIMMRFFGTAQRAWTTSTARTEVFENAKLTMDLISRELQSSMYNKTSSNFLNDPTTHTLCFISSTMLPQEGSTSSVSEVRYKLDTTSDKAWLQRSVTGNNDTRWNFMVDHEVATFNDSSSDDFHNIIPYVTQFDVSCLKPDGSAVTDNMEFPGIIKITLSLLDKNSFLKYKALIDAGNATVADEFKSQRERTFTKVIFLGDRGQ